VRRARRPRVVATILALAVVLLALSWAGPRGLPTRPHLTARTTVAGHGHRPQLVPLRRPDRDTEQHRRTVPATMAPVAAAAAPRRGEGPTGPGPQAPRTTTARPTGRGPPAGM